MESFQSLMLEVNDRLTRQLFGQSACNLMAHEMRCGEI